MTRRAARTIYKKEILDTLRDRRTLATMLLVPMVGYPLALIFTTETIAVQQKSGAERIVRVMAGTSTPDPIIRALDGNVSIHVQTSSTVEARREKLDLLARELLTTDDFDLVLFGAPDARTALTSSGTAELTLLYDATKPHAEAALVRVEDTLKIAAKDLRDARLAKHSLPPSTAEPIAIIKRSISTDTEVGNQLAGSVLPALVVLFIAISSFYPAVDLTAGEKERKTLATLLCAPVAPLDLVAGKYLAVLTVGILAGMLNVLVLAMTLLRVIAAEAPANVATPAFSIAPLTMVGLLISAVLVAMPVAAMMLLVGTLARSFRDASNLLTPVLLLCTVPAVLASLPGTELTPMSAFIPLANASLLMKALLLERADVAGFAITVICTLIVTAFILLLAARTFADERVLFSTEGRRADLRSVLFSPPPLGASTGVAFAGVAFVASYYAGLLAERSAPMTLVVITQLAAHFVPALLLARWLAPRLAPTELLSLRRPSTRALSAALLIGLGAWLGLSLPSAWLTDLLVPGQEQMAEAFKNALGLDRLSLPIAILALAVLPAIAEEIAFRGVLFGLFSRSMKPLPALVLQALIFGAAHGSIYRMLPTALLGFVLGVLVQRTRSVWPAMLTHAMTNAILLSIERLGSAEFGEKIATPTPWALAGVLLVLLGLMLCRGRDESR